MPPKRETHLAGQHEHAALVIRGEACLFAAQLARILHRSKNLRIRGGEILQDCLRDVVETAGGEDAPVNVSALEGDAVRRRGAEVSLRAVPAIDGFTVVDTNEGLVSLHNVSASQSLYQPACGQIKRNDALDNIER